MSNENKLKDDSEYQRRNRMSHDERCIEAIDRSVKRLKDWDHKQGGQKTESEIRKYMTDLAHKEERKKSG